MILIKKVAFDEVPLLSLKGWKLHGQPIVEQRVYGSATDFRGYSHQGTTSIDIFQTMIKDIPLNARQFAANQFTSNLVASTVLLDRNKEKEINIEIFKNNKEDVSEYLQSISQQNKLFDGVRSELESYGWKVVWKERNGYGYPDLEYKYETR